MNESTIPQPFFTLLRRNLFFCLLLALSFESLHAQSYRPFHANAVAVYTTAPVAGETSSLAFVETDFLEGDSIFYPVKTFDPDNWDGMMELEVDSCEENFWSTGDMCHPENVPLWLGAEMRKTGGETYEYTTASGEILTFDFGIAEDDSALVYQNSDMQLYLIAEGESTGNFLEIEDSIFQYRLAHLNLEGEALGSALHEAPIILGAELGAIHFMQINSFPQILQPIVLVGHSGAQAGLYSVKKADVYDFQEGDIFQYFYSNNLGNPFESESYYETRTVMERVENETHINYTFNVHRFTPDSTIDTFIEEQSFVKWATLAFLPFELQEIEGPGSTYFPNGYRFQNLTLTDDSCGSTFSYSSTGSFYHSCQVEGINCFGNTWHITPPEYYVNPSNIIYRQGLGMTYSFEGWTTDMSGSETRGLIYSSKNGIECGNQIILSTDIQEAGKQTLIVYPNPVKDLLNVHLKSGSMPRNAQLELYDVLGQQHITTTVTPGATTYNLQMGHLPSGMYVLRCVTDSDAVWSGKVLKE